jgi:hypothetical protein
MKKVSVLSALAFTIIATAHAQSAQVRIKVKETEVPVAVATAFKSDFAGDQSEEWEIVPAKALGEEYSVSGYDDLDGQQPSAYSVRIKGKDTKGAAMYDKEGKLLFSKEVIKNTALPSAVTNAVLKKYPGYSILKDEEKIKQGKSTFIHYRVIIEKGKDKRVVAVDEGGAILRERKVLM